jgi:hypothetical protein
MFIRCLICSISLLFIIINAQKNYDTKKIPQSSIDIAEHEPSDINIIDSDHQSWQTTTERTLIRVTRLNTKTDKPKINKRQRRQIIEAIQTAGFVISVAKAIRNTESGEEILGMAKKVAIAVIVIVSLCIVCCLTTTVVICVKCCGGRNNRKRNEGPTTVQVPQPIFVHTGPAGYQTQYHHQHAPQTWSPIVIPSPESRPMLPQPSAPPLPNDHFNIEHPPPPYEKLYTSK